MSWHKKVLTIDVAFTIKDLMKALAAVPPSCFLNIELRTSNIEQLLLHTDDDIDAPDNGIGLVAFQQDPNHPVLQPDIPRKQFDAA